MKNSIHEPGSRTMSKNRLRSSTESNRAKNRLSAPSAQPIGPASRPSRAPCRAPAACCARPASQRLPARPARSVARPPTGPRDQHPNAREPPRAHAPSRAPAPARASPACACCARPARPAQPSVWLPYAQWAVAHFRFCIPFFFISFSHWKIPKIYLLIFFHFPVH